MSGPGPGMTRKFPGRALSKNPSRKRGRTCGC
jgi:hypothetical protein